MTMKKTTILRGIAVLVIAGAALLAGCSNIMEPPAGPEAGTGGATGQVSITIEGTGADEAGRTLLPSAPAFSKYVLGFTPKGGQAAVSPVTVQNGTRHVMDLAAGNWTITAVGYVNIQGVSGISNGEYEAARGETDVTVSSGGLNAVFINLNAGVEQGQQGIFSYNITLPTTTPDSAFLRILTLEGSHRYERNLKSDAAGSFGLDAGYYLLKITLTTGGKDTVRTGVIHIYGGLTTKAEGLKYDFTAFTSIAEVAYYLNGLPQNAAVADLYTNGPYTVALKGLNLETDTIDHYDSLAKIMEALEGKYVNLDLSACTGTRLRDTWGYDNSTPNKDKVVSIILPATITNIDGNNFRWYTSLTNIEFPGLVSIGSSVFDGCTALESVEFPETLNSIGSNAFAGCTALKDVYLPAAANSFNGSPFPDKEDLTFHVSGDGPTSILEEGKILICRGGIIEYNAPKTGAIVIPEGITGIGTGLFSNAAITSVTLPESLTSIANSAFEYCVSLTEIQFPAALTDIGQGAFRGCTLLESADLSGTGVTYISGSLFSGCSALETVVLPQGLTAIGNTYYDYGYQGAFQGCTSLASVNLADTQLATIGDGAFRGCLSLTPSTLTLPGTLTTIENGAFRDCPLITSIQLPDSITAINGGSDYAGGGAFENSGLTAIDLSNTQITGIGDQAFRDCSSLETVILPENLRTIGGTHTFGLGVFENCTALTEIELPDTLTGIAGGTFNNCSSITFLGSGNDYFSIIGNGKGLIVGTVLHWYTNPTGDIVIPEGVTDIGALFRGTGITSISLPDSLASIGGNAFYNCTSLKSVDLSDTSITTIPVGTFSNCTALESIELPDTLTTIASDTSLSSGVFENCSSLTSITLPEGFTSIGYRAFYNCTALKSITLPSTLTSIYEPSYSPGVFENCTALESIDLSACSSLAGIGYRTFTGCTSLESVRLPDNLTSIGVSIFSGCTSLTSIDLPDNLTSIGVKAFSGCTSLESIDLPDGLESLGGGTFYGCTSLTSIDLPDGLTSLPMYDYDGSGMFEDCSSLTSIDLPDGLESLGGDTFYGCSSLTSLTLPGGLGSIGRSFYGCSSLTVIVSLNTTPPKIIVYETFYDTSENLLIYVPDASVAAYKSAQYWSNRASQIKALSELPAE
jgi:hypothetical protein